jgi:hypothetical protein
MIKPVHDDIPVLQFYFAGSRPATTRLAAAPPWTHRLVDQSPLRDARSCLSRSVDRVRHTCTRFPNRRSIHLSNTPSASKSP